MIRVLLRALWCIHAFLLLSPVPTSASSLKDTLAGDFAPLSGYVVHAALDDYLLDIGTGQGAAVGDLFCVVENGVAITHPVTGEPLGTEERVKGILRLTRLESGFSHSVPVGPFEGAKRGDVIRRFHGVEAVFWDYTDKNEQLARDLRTGLPHLRWKSYVAARQLRPEVAGRPEKAGPALYFILSAQGLEVRAPDFELIRSYPAPDSTPGPSPAAAAPAPVPVSAAVSPVFETVQVWSDVVLQGTPVGIETGDFDGDGNLELAVAFEDRIEIGRLGQEGTPSRETIRLAAGSHAYALDAADLDGNGRPELYLSALNGNGNPGSVFIEHSADAYRMVKSSAPWHLRRMTLPGEGNVLLAQAFGGQGREFSGPVFRVKREGDRLRAGDPLRLPPSVTLYGFAVLPGEQGNLFACLDDDGYLSILTGTGRKLGGSVDKVGGSESYFTMYDEVAGGGEPREVYLKPRVEAVAGGVIVVSANSGQLWSASLRRYAKTELKRLRWDGRQLKEAWHSEPEKGYLADIGVVSDGSGASEKLLAAVALPATNPLAPREVVLRIHQELRRP